jgi:hypothetical protein
MNDSATLRGRGPCMRVFWLNGGLHVEPENEVETEAMLVLLGDLKYERPPESDGPRTSDVVLSLGDVERGLDLDL